MTDASTETLRQATSIAAISPDTAANSTPAILSSVNAPEPKTTPPVLDANASVLDAVARKQALIDFKATLFELVDVAHVDIVDNERKSFISRLFGPYRLNPLRWLFPWYQTTPTFDELLAKYVSLWPTLERPESQQYSMPALLGIKFLRTGRIKTSSEIFAEIEFHTSTPAALSYVMKGVSIFIRSLLLLILAFAYIFSLLVPVLVNDLQLSQTLIHSISLALAPGIPVLVSTVCGMIGSVISILLRLGEFETTKGRSKAFLLLTGATLPLVGGVFGAFVAALFSANVINISIGGQNPVGLWIYVVIGFLSGFSERFSRGFIQIAETRFGSTSQPTSGGIHAGESGGSDHGEDARRGRHRGKVIAGG